MLPWGTKTLQEEKDGKETPWDTKVQLVDILVERKEEAHEDQKSQT